MNRKLFDWIELGLIIGIILFVNIISWRYFFRIDLTEDKHFTLSDNTKETLSQLNQKVYIEVFLDGELSPDYERLKNAIREKLEECTIYSKEQIQFRFTNPNAIEDLKIRNQFASQLIQRGVEYRYERIEKEGATTEQLVFPSAIISSRGKEVPIVFLKGNKTAPIEEQLNQSLEIVEYQLMAALRKLNNEVSGYVGFIEGLGTLPAEQVADLSASLSDYYHVHRLRLNDSIDLSKYGTLILARPTIAFSEVEKFLLDQYVQNGGNLFFLMDGLKIDTDSLMNGYTYALPYDLNIADLLFKWGIRCNPDVIKDINCSLLKVAVGNANQTQMVNWTFHPIIYNYGKHVTVRNLDAIMAQYPSSIDTVKAVGIEKTPLLFSSQNTKLIEAPSKIDLNETRKNDDPKSFHQGIFPISYLLEGKFQSAYKNRPSPISGRKVITSGKNSKIIFVSDADIIRNEIDNRSSRPVPLGFDKATQYQFSNKEFALNAIDYLMNQKILELRSKEIALRPLDKVKVKEEKLNWQIINLLFPSILLLAFGAGRYYWRKRKYEQH